MPNVLADYRRGLITYQEYLAYYPNPEMDLVYLDGVPMKIKTHSVAHLVHAIKMAQMDRDFKRCECFNRTFWEGDEYSRFYSAMIGVNAFFKHAAIYVSAQYSL